MSQSQQLALWPEIPDFSYSATKLRRITKPKPVLLPFAANPVRYSELVLASASPSKADILTRLGLKFSVDPADIDERAISYPSPQELVAELARRKGFVVAERHEEALVISADTLIVGPSGVIGKPIDRADALRTLSELNGRSHTVITGLMVVDTTAKVNAQRLVATDVRFRSQSEESLSRYVFTGEPMGKAGAYALQGIGALLVAEIKGEYTNVLGLPVSALVDALFELGYEVI